VEVGNGGNGPLELVFLQPIGAGGNTGFALVKTFGVNTAGAFSGGGFASYANNAYSGATTVNGGLTEANAAGTVHASNIFGGTNASNSLNVVNAAVSLQGANGSFGAATGVRVVSGGVLTLNDVSGTPSAFAGNAPLLPAGVRADRLNPAAILTLDGGTLTLLGSATADVTQTIATVSVPRGFNQVSLVAGSGRNAVLTAGDLSVAAGGSLVVGGTGLGTTARLMVTGSTPTPAGGLIPGLYVAATPGGVPSTFARYSGGAGGEGVVGLGAGEYQANDFTVGSTTNVDVTSTATVSTNNTVNGVRTNSSITINGGQTLTLGAGGFLVTGTAGLTVGGPGTLAFGSAPGRIMNANSAATALTITTPITGTAGLYRSGVGTMSPTGGNVTGAVTLAGDLSGLTGGLVLDRGTTNLNTATYNGGIHLLSGTLATNANIGTGGAVTLGSPTTASGAVGAPATLNINTAAIPNFGRDLITVGGDDTSPFAGTSGLHVFARTDGNQSLSGTITLGTHLSVSGATTPGAVTTLGGPISGNGGINVVTGNVALTNVNAFRGGMQLNAGSVTSAITDAAFGSGDVRLAGGTLRTAYSGLPSFDFNRGLRVLSSSTFDVSGNNIVLKGLITGENPGATLTRTGNGTLSLVEASPFPGTLANAVVPPTVLPTTIVGGVTLTGPNGALTGATAVVVPTSTSFTLDNATDYNPNRLGDATTVAMSGGLFTYIAPAVPTSDPAERFGTLVVNPTPVPLDPPGVLNIDASLATSPTILRFAGLVVNGGTLTIRGTNLGGTTGNYTRVYFDDVPSSETGLIGGLTIATTAGTSPASQLTVYDPALGLIPFTPPPVSGTVIDNFNPIATPVLAEFTTTGAAVANTGVQIFSLVLDGGSLSLNDVNPATTGIHPVGNQNTPIGTLRLLGGQITSRNGAKTIQAGTGTAAKVVNLGSFGAQVNALSDLTVANGVTLTGTGGLTKVGAGTFTVSGAYSVTGATLVTDGTMTFGPTANIGSNVNPRASGTGVMNLNVATTFPSIAAFGGGVVNINAATTTTTLTANTGGTVNVNAATLAATLAGPGSVVIAGGQTLTTVAINQTLTATISGAGSLAYTPGSVSAITLAATNTFSGGVTGNPAARFNLTNPNGFGTGLVNLTAQNSDSNNGTPTLGYDFGAGGAGGVVLNDFAFTANAVNVVVAQSNVNTAGQTLRLTGVLSGGSTTTGLVFDEVGNSRANVVALTNPSNTFRARIDMVRGTLAVSSDAALGNAGNPIRLLNATPAPGGDLRFDAGIALGAGRTVTAASAGGASINTNGFTGTINGVLDGSAALTKTGAGTLILNNATNTYTGTVAVNAGTLMVNGTLPGAATPPAVSVATGGTLAGSGTLGGPGALRNVTVTAAATLAPGGLTIGTLTVNGDVTLTAGAVGAGGAPSNGSIFAVRAARGGSPNTVAANDQLAYAGNLNFLGLDAGTPNANSNKFRIHIVSDAASPLFSFETYTMTLAGGTGQIQRNSGQVNTSTYTFDPNDYQLTSPTFDSFNSVSLVANANGTLVLTFTPVPEPGTVFAVGGAVLAAGAFVRRRWKGTAGPAAV
jgi:autotransporter-associated beta strand protein